MKILFVVSEIYPIVKTGGLADVAGSLPMALRDLGLDVRVMLPCYRGVVALTGEPDAWHPIGDPLGAGETRLGLVPATEDLPTLWLVDCPALFDQPGGPYLDGEGNAWPDNHLRFAMLSRAAALICDAGALVGWQPDILHAHDWHTGLAPAYLALRAGNRPKSVFTIHNLLYMGLFSADRLAEVALPPECFTPNGVEFFGELSFMKAGLRYSDHITTVSPTYAKEILRDEAGNGLAGLLRSRRAHLTGILNGIDERTWNPATDPLIVSGYDPDRLDGKAANKAALLREFGLPAGDGPLLAIISRLTTQKGLDLVLEVLPDIMREGAKVVVLGAGERDIERAFDDAVRTYPDGVAVRLAYDEALSHRIQAGADLLLMPSRFEPCGLTQLYALRYGTLPVVHETGGLADTVVDTGPAREGTGFVFAEASAAALLAALRRAFDLYAEPERWRTVQRRAMTQQFGWSTSAGRYRDLYRNLVAERTRAPSN